MTTPDFPFEFVRFAVEPGESAEARLALLRQAVDSLAKEKSKDASGQMEPDDGEELTQWLSILPPDALATFETEPSVRAWLPPSGLIEPGWDALSMLGSILGGETRLHGVYATAPGIAELRFEGLAWPYGGITSLIRLVESFGFDIISYDEGSMPEVSRATHLEWTRR